MHCQKSRQNQAQFRIKCTILARLKIKNLWCTSTRKQPQQKTRIQSQHTPSGYRPCFTAAPWSCTKDIKRKTADEIRDLMLPWKTNVPQLPLPLWLGSLSCITRKKKKGGRGTSYLRFILYIKKISSWEFRNKGNNSCQIENRMFN